VIYQTLLFFLIPKNLIQNGPSLSLILDESTLAHNIVFASFGSFSDVPSTHPNFEAIEYIKAKNIVNGYPDGTFRPDAMVNRAEFTKIIIEAYYSEQASGSNCFPDVGTEWFAKYVCFAKISNFVTGYPDGSFKPTESINFVEIAKILVNIKGLLVTPYPNPDFSPWYKPYVEKLAEAHAIPASITSFSQKVTRGEMAEMVYRLQANVTDKPSITYQEQASPGLPVHLKIPGINVDSAIESVSLTPEGAVGIPKDPDNAAWYNLGPIPGNIGSAVMSGHVNWYYGAKGVFENLNKLKPGDKIEVLDDKGSTISFVVRESRSYDAAADATDVFYSKDGKAHLNLITCEGVWNKLAKQYSKRLVVFADRVTE
jgi:LPXTG-site transpeptidase (sortase) family protein